MKKFILAAGALTAVVAPVATVVSCGKTIKKAITVLTVDTKIVDEWNYKAMELTTTSIEYKLNAGQGATITKSGDEYTTKGILEGNKVEGNNGIPTIEKGGEVKIVFTRTSLTINGSTPKFRFSGPDFNNKISSLYQYIVSQYSAYLQYEINQYFIHNLTLEKNFEDQGVLTMKDGYVYAKGKVANISQDKIGELLKKIFVGYNYTSQGLNVTAEDTKQEYDYVLNEIKPKFGTEPNKISFKIYASVTEII